MKSVSSATTTLGPLLVLLPGLDGTGRLFRAFVECLPASVDSVIVPLPSEAASDYDSIARSIVPQLPKDRPLVLLGESFSGPLALKISVRGDLNVVAVILVASFIRRPVAWLPSIARFIFGAAIFRLPWQRFFLNHLLADGKAPGALLRETMTSLHSNDHHVLAGRIRAALSVDATEAFTRCPVPILYLRGDQDRLIDPNTADALKRLRPDLECRTIQAPHFVLQIAPADAARAVCDYLSLLPRVVASPEGLKQDVQA
jgi:pimeloyl-[acyl-carrier protein] methyl ester esterase